MDIDLSSGFWCGCYTWDSGLDFFHGCCTWDLDPGYYCSYCSCDSDPQSKYYPHWNLYPDPFYVFLRPFWRSLSKTTKQFAKICNNINYICRSCLKELYPSKFKLYSLWTWNIYPFEQFLWCKTFSYVAPEHHLWEYEFYISVTIYSFLLFKCHLLIPP